MDITHERASRGVRILHVVRTLDPAQGGVPEAAHQLAAALAQITARSDVLTLDAPDAAWLGRSPESTFAIGPSLGRYGFSLRLNGWLRRRMSEYDAIIIHGVWEYQTVAVARIARLSGVPYFVYVHGQLDPWFRRAFPLKHAKKWLYWWLLGHKALRGARGVLFTSEDERQLARGSFGLYRVNDVIANIGIPKPDTTPEARRARFYSKYPELRRKRLILFMSRIHPKKGLDLLIDAFAEIAEWDSTLHIVVAGPDHHNMVRGLERRATTLGVAGRITWTGMLEGEDRWDAYATAEVFCLPSHSENFGLVVVEALAFGVPVLISNKVNIWREIQAGGAGLVAADTVAGVRSLLRHWITLEDDARARMSQRAICCFADRFEIGRAAKELLLVVERSVNTADDGSVGDYLS